LKHFSKDYGIRWLFGQKSWFKILMGKHTKRFFLYKTFYNARKISQKISLFFMLILKKVAVYEMEKKRIFEAKSLI